MPTPDQKSSTRPIYFVFQNTAEQQKPFVFPLIVRPEDLTRTDQSRLHVHQTLGGAFIDNFGAGLPSINISGVTGWGQGSRPDGQAQFQMLFDTVFARWHRERADAIRLGKDPDRVKLIFIDELDKFAGVVSPVQFVLKRSKSKPLLSQYTINMTLISTDIADTQNTLALPVSAQSAAQESLAASIAKIIDFSDWLNSITSSVLGPIRKQVAQFTAATAGVLQVVNDVVSGVKEASGYTAVMNIAGNLSRAGANVMHTIRTIYSLPQQASAMFGRVASAFENIACLLKNSLSNRQFLPDYDDLYGSSSCSSTAGGAPISKYDTENPFGDLFPIEGVKQEFSTLATQSIHALANSDTVLSPMTPTDLGSHMNAITNGVVIA